ncbi:hypothetical protein [Pseudomonas fluorescens]|uniref:hypothetical protein n=1 Tax=Pseudomonas fluorescens TaxID=294 RepID=UPI001BEBA6FB|nr:hypothetical protein [Pseudomonas fluorescens]MBT2374384.1 hypothetical protein [Pseudomonas fluorescens]
MINLTEKLIILKYGAPSLTEIVDQIAHECRPKAEMRDSPNKQARHRYALNLLLELRNGSPFSLEDFSDLFELSTTEKHSTEELNFLYKKLSGVKARFISDIHGLQTPLRAIFMQLWHAGEVLLPYTFTDAGVSTKYPNLRNQTSFITSLVTNEKRNLLTCANLFKYKFSWREPMDISFEELWEAAPAVCELQSKLRTDKTLRVRFRYLSWLEVFAGQYPNIVTIAQVAYLKKYHEHLHASATSNYAEIAKSYDEFVDYWKVDPLKYDKLSEKEKSSLRYRSRINPNAVKRGKKVTKQEAELNSSLTRASAADFEGYSAYDGYLFITKKNRKQGRSEPAQWVANNYYHGVNGLDTEVTGRFWKAAAQALTDDMKSHGYSRSHRKSVQANINLLLDYVFLYLALWYRENLVTTYEPPLYVNDFDRTRFWSSIRDTKSLFFTQGEDAERPLTLLAIYVKTRTKKAAKRFCRDIYDFFEFCRAHRKEIFVNGSSIAPEDFDNPVFLNLDAPGSGGRTQTDKVPLPIDSVAIARAYITSLDRVGCLIRDKIISGAISAECAKSLSKDTWIDLSTIGIEETIIIQGGETEKLIIQLDEIINSYHWKLYDYTRPDGSKIFVMLPWMSSLRMLQVALFGGQRVQHAQWLDVYTFDFYEPPPHAPSRGWCSLLVNTDKSGEEHISSIPHSVFEALLDERNFQLETYALPYTSVHYENDENNGTYDKIFPLFRSFWNSTGLPFSDTTYSKTWVKVLQGIEREFNKLVPEQRQHAFVYQNDQGQCFAHHTPHSLRASWITHQKLYGHLDYGPIGKQVSHKSPSTSSYYVKIEQEYLENAISISDGKMMQASIQRLMGVTTIQPSSSKSSLQKGWREDRSRCLGQQHAVSKFSGLIETMLSGKDLINESTQSRVAFLTICICMLNGKCPSELLAFTHSPQHCGLCPYAVFGLDHLGALHAKVRRLTDEIDTARERLKYISSTQVSSLENEEANRRLTLLCLEQAGYVQAIEILNKRLTLEGRLDGFICRHREIDQTLTIDVDMDDPIQRIFAQILDWKLYPAFASEHYPATLYKLAKTPELKNLLPQTLEESDIYANQILSIIRSGVTSFEAVTQLMQNKPSELAHEKY